MTNQSTAVHEQQAELLAHVIGSICSRTLNQFAQEARLDGESLMDAVERYEIDYAWHVLGSQRLRDATVALLAAKLGQPVSDAQQRCIAEVLTLAAAQQPAELLMSFDSDLPEQLAAKLFARFGHKEKIQAADALS